MLNITYHQGNANQNHHEISIISNLWECLSSKNNINKKCWQRCGEKRILVHCWWECKLVQSLWNTVWSFLNKLKIELPHEPGIPLLGIYPPPKKKKTPPIKKDTYIPMFIAALFIIAKMWKKLKYLLTHEWVKKIELYRCGIYTTSQP